MTHTTICESTVKIKKKHIKSDHCQMTHTTIWELNLINKKETNVKYNHRQMTHTNICESTVKR